MVGVFVFGNHCTYRCPYCINFVELNGRAKLRGPGTCVSPDDLDAVVQLINGWPEPLELFNLVGGEPSTAPGVLEAMARVHNVRVFELTTNGADLHRLRRWVECMPAYVHLCLPMTMHAWRFTQGGRVDRRAIAAMVAAARSFIDDGVDVELKLLIGRDQLADALYMQFVEAVYESTEGDHSLVDVRPIRGLNGRPTTTVEALVLAMAELGRCPQTPVVKFLRRGLLAKGDEHVESGCLRIDRTCRAVGNMLFINGRTVGGCPRLSTPVDVGDEAAVRGLIRMERRRATYVCMDPTNCDVHNCGLLVGINRGVGSVSKEKG